MARVKRRKTFGQRTCPECLNPFEAKAANQIRCKRCSRSIRIKRAAARVDAKRQAAKAGRRHCLVDMGAFGFIEGVVLGECVQDGERMFVVRFANTRRTCDFSPCHVREAA